MPWLTIRDTADTTTDATSIQCVECSATAEGSAEGWRAYLGGGFEGLPLEVAAFCPACAAWEFGDT